MQFSCRSMVTSMRSIWTGGRWLVVHVGSMSRLRFKKSPIGRFGRKIFGIFFRDLLWLGIIRRTNKNILGKCARNSGKPIYVMKHCSGFFWKKLHWTLNFSSFFATPQKTNIDTNNGHILSRSPSFWVSSCSFSGMYTNTKTAFSYRHQKKTSPPNLGITFGVVCCIHQDLIKDLIQGWHLKGNPGNPLGNSAISTLK